MKILKSLNKKTFLIIISLILCINSYAEEKPVDIWNIEQKSETEILNDDSTSSLPDNEEDPEVIPESSLYELQLKKKKSSIKLDENILTINSEIFGLYDPEDNGLDINMWANSDGDQLKNILSKLNKIDLSKDASEIMRISFLTNAHSPKINITEEEFLKFKSDWLIKNSNLDLIEEYLIKNQTINLHTKLSKHLMDEHLSTGNIKKVCEIFSKNLKPINDEYLTQYNVYCLIISDKKEEAQLILDLKKELGFNNKYFEKKINHLLGYTSEVSNEISEKSILDFHLAHQINTDFSFEPKENTSKIIWKYLSALNLLNSFEQIEISNTDKISMIEKATHNKNYPEKDLLEIYKRFQFNINQLINIDQSYKSLSNIEGRALIYQKILLESETKKKLKLLKILKNLFKKDNIGKAFDIELKNILEKIEINDIPDNLTSFYYTNIQIKQNEEKKVKFNNDILHQSKIINYFNGDYSKAKIEKDVNNFLKKIKKNKKYFFSKKDQILLESLKFDGIKIQKKYDDLYDVNNSEIPTDIQVMINNNEKGAALLRIIEIIGQDKLDRIDDDTIYFIISTLNQLNIGLLRNKILLKVLPLKV
jgi:hypothetical protein